MDGRMNHNGWLDKFNRENAVVNSEGARRLSPTTPHDFYVQGYTVNLSERKFHVLAYSPAYKAWLDA